ncbi:MAG: VIT family protein [Betaproteobacteria bacterium]
MVGSHVHRTHHTGWIRATVLGANDGVLSIASLVLGVAAAHTNQAGIVVASVAGLVAGALSMGAGEYVSVSSQADTERADLEIERNALNTDYDNERNELTEIYVRRGLDRELASEVAEQLMAHDALGAHARDDIGISEALAARPLQAAMASLISFAVGGVVPLIVALVAPRTALFPAVVAVSLTCLLVLGASAARAGGAPMIKGAVRVLLWGVLAMGVTTAVGALFASVV